MFLFSTLLYTKLFFMILNNNNSVQHDEYLLKQNIITNIKLTIIFTEIIIVYLQYLFLSK